MDKLLDELRFEARRQGDDFIQDGMKYIEQMTYEKRSQENRYSRGEPSFAAAHRGVDLDLINSLKPAGYKDESPPRRFKKKRFIN